MKYLAHFLILLVFIPISHGSPLKAEEITTEITIEHHIDFEQTSNLASMNDFEAIYSWFPSTTTSQTVTAERDARLHERNGEVIYETDNAVDTTLRSTYTVRSQRDEPWLRTASSLQNRDAYLASSDLVAVTPEIRSVAETVAGDATSEYEAVLLLAEWVNENIAYNLSTLNVQAQKSSDTVLRERQGVCDELTVLFLAMTRSLDIPSRYVSGLAYTNSPLFEEEWGAHGWAEVYVEGEGWVPVDPTYAQYGYVDAGHIAMYKGAEPAKYTAEFQWRGAGYDVTTSTEESVTVLSEKEQTQPLIDVDFKPRHEIVGFGSDNELIIAVQNPTMRTIPVTSRIGGTEGLLIQSDNPMVTLIPPESQRELRHIVRADPYLDAHYQYQFPVVVSVNDFNFNTSFRAKWSADHHTYDAGTNELRCNPPRAVYTGEPFTITCIAEEDICINDLCQESPALFEFNTEKPETYTFTSEDLEDTIDVAPIERPPTTLDISVASTVKYGENFMLRIRGGNVPRGTLSTITVNDVELQSRNITQSQYRYEVSIPSDALQSQNQISVRLGDQTTTKHVTVEPGNILERILLVFNDFFGARLELKT